jgi:hypothetical protein
MNEEEISVRLEVAAPRHNLIAGDNSWLWSRVGGTNYIGTRSVITYLNLNPGVLNVGQMYRIADMEGKTLMNDAEIRATVKKPTAARASPSKR